MHCHQRRLPVPARRVFFQRKGGCGHRYRAKKVSMVAATLVPSFQKFADEWWRAHSCVPRRDSSRRLLVADTNSEGCIETSLDRTGARATFVFQKVLPS